MVGVVFSGVPRNIGAVRTYYCDVKALRLSTNIEVHEDDQAGEELYDINGNIIKFVTDPLTMYEDDQIVAYSDQKFDSNQKSG